MPKKYHPGLSLALIIIFSVALTSSLSGGTSHEVTGTLSYSGGAGTPSSITFSAYITARPGEVLTQSSSGCSYNSGSGLWTVECGSFATQWSAGEILHVSFTDGGTGGAATDNVTLSSGASDNGGLTPIPCPNITISPSSLNFDEVEVGDYKDLTMTIGNNGNATLQVSDLNISGLHASHFSIVGGNAPFSVGSGGTHAITVRFTAVYDCGKWATLSIQCNDPDDLSPDCDLEGKACGADITANPRYHNFGTVPPGSSMEYTFTIHNYGERECIVSSTSISGSGDFTIVSGGGSFTMPHHSDRDLVVRFTPSSEGSKSATISMDSNDPLDDPFVLSVSGTGLLVTMPLILVSPTTTGFGSVAVGSHKDATITVRNTGTADLQVTNTVLGGDDPEYFHIISGGGPFTVPPGGTQYVVVRFAPTLETWARDWEAFLRIESNASNKMINLEGRSGIPKMVVSDRNHDFGEVVLNTPTTWVFTIENEGWEVLNVNEISIRGENFSEFAVTGGQAPLRVWRNYPDEVRITFQPVSIGEKNAEIIIISDDPNDPREKIVLTGVGVEGLDPGQPDIVLSSQALDFGEVSADSSAVKNLLVINNGEADLDVFSMSISGNEGFSAAWLASDKETAMAITSDADTMTIAAGDTEYVAVTFSPDTTGEQQAILALQSNDPDQETVEVSLAGTGIVEETIPDPEPEPEQLVLHHCYPPSQAASVPVNVKIQFAIQGLVDHSVPLDAAVNGESIISDFTDQTGGQVDINMNGNGCRVCYHPIDPFEENSEVTVSIQCGEIDTSYSFHTGQCENKHLAAGVVSQTGGIVTCDSTGLDIEIPEGAVEDTVEISIGLVSNTPDLPEGIQGMGLSYHFGPEGFTFHEPVIIHLPYTAEDLLNANVSDPEDLQIYYYLTMTGEWILLEVIGADEHNVYVQVDQFCYLTMGSIPRVDTRITDDIDAQPRTMTLFQNYPNPFNPETHIPFYIPEPGHVRFEIYNAKGQLIRLLLDENRESGHHEVLWNGMDDQRVSVGSGVYYLMIYCRDRTIVGKAVLVK